MVVQLSVGDSLDSLGSVVKDFARRAGSSLRNDEMVSSAFDPPNPFFIPFGDGVG
jgi:hypothetical protein